METLQVGPHSTLRQLQVCRMFLLLLPLLLISATSLATACSGDQDCPAELYCYKMICSTPDQIAELAFSAGKIDLILHGVVWSGGCVDNTLS